MMRLFYVAIFCDLLAHVVVPRYLQGVHFYVIYLERTRVPLV